MDALWLGGGALALAVGAGWVFIGRHKGDGRSGTSDQSNNGDETGDPALAVARQRVRALLSLPQYSGSFAESRAGTGALTRAVSDLLERRVVVTSPSSIDAALLALEQGDSAPAETLFSEMATTDGESAARAHCHLGAISGLRDDAAALVAYRNAREHDAASAEACTMLGLLLVRTEQSALAQDALETVIKLETAEPSFKAIAHRHLAKMHLDRDALDDAAAHYESAIRLDTHAETPDLAQSYNGLGGVYMLRCEYDRAHDAFQSALAITTKRGDKLAKASVLANLGSIHSIKGDRRKARKHFEQALQLAVEMGDKGGIASFHAGLGQLDLNENKFERALRNFNKQLVLEMEVQNKVGVLQAYQSIGLVLMAWGAHEAAIGIYEKYLALAVELERKGDICNAHLNFAIVHCMPQGNTELALQHALQARDLSTEIGAASLIAMSNERLAVVYGQLGQAERARECLEHALQLSVQAGDAESAEHFRTALAQLERGS